MVGNIRESRFSRGALPDPLFPPSASAHSGPRDDSTSSQSPEPTPLPSPASTSVPALQTQRKKRRPKRSEEERINFFRTDPYVAQFEAYRVLCAGCDKWIRLRSNSSYCSIPWEAHRKSCLAKKGWDLSISIKFACLLTLFPVLQNRS